MDVSIIIPFYERQADLEALLDSLSEFASKGFAIETLIVEDGSLVANKSQLKMRHRVLNPRFILNDRNMGPAFSRNRGAEEATARYLWFIDSDAMILRSDTLGTLVDALENDPTILVAGGVIEEVEGVNYVLRPVLLAGFHYLYEKVSPYEKAISRDNYQEVVSYLSTTNFFISRRNFFAAGGFDTTLKIAEDPDFCMRLQSVLGGKFFQSVRTLVLHKASDSGRDTGLLAYFSDQRAYMLVKFKTRNILLRRYKRWRLAFLPFIELISIVRFIMGLREGKWHLSRTGKAKSGSPVKDWSQTAVILIFYCLLGMGFFFLPSSPSKRLPERATTRLAEKN